ncbi:hypothetical protein [Dysgonomonas sp. 511]|uniref:hypothetical protein n=1 Tax=Dysgonomonas sp. 511 TaxID=2302930 RepID=UPI0013D0B99A|nr:hypothetical protein [Dysgonomonas sp. 511]NDV78747.1 hypothetical protein [Dysgonomonas sp. 511]
MRRWLLFIFILPVFPCFSQDYSNEKTSLANFLKRMHNQTAFEGVKVVEDYDNTYLISALSLDKSKYKSDNILNRVAQVKARQQVSVFLNGSTISSDLIIRTTETKKRADSEIIIETTEILKEHSVGFVNEIELLINFIANTDNNKVVYIFIKRLDKDNNHSKYNNL